MTGNEARRRIVAGVTFYLAFTYISLSLTYLCVTRFCDLPYIRRYNDEPAPKLHVLAAELTAANGPMPHGGHGLGSPTLVANLPDEYVPTYENKRRLIVVGDIHGMDASLAALLDKAGFDNVTDHLVAAGDMINKGPDSAGVISRLMELGASAVRGNHEDRILLALTEAAARAGADDYKRKSSSLTTGQSLSKAHVRWLANLPVILAAEPLSMYIVHAGLVPGVRPELQDPWAVMNMRTLVYLRPEADEMDRKRDVRASSSSSSSSSSTRDDDGGNNSDGEKHKHEAEQSGSHAETQEGDSDPDTGANDSPSIDRDVAIPVEGRDGEKWTAAWNRHQMRLKRRSRHTVVYGHDSKRGFRKGKYTFGLDSGCVKGGALTALVVKGTKGAGWKQRTIQVQCEAP